MTYYINKDALIAEIDNLQSTTMDEDGNFYTAKAQAEYNVLCDLESFIDTLEVKEVDLEKEIKRFTMSKELYEANSVIKAVAEHFFELGLKAQKGE